MTAPEKSSLVSIFDPLAECSFLTYALRLLGQPALLVCRLKERPALSRNSTTCPNWRRFQRSPASASGACFVPPPLGPPDHVAAESVKKLWPPVNADERGSNSRAFGSAANRFLTSSDPTVSATGHDYRNAARRVARRGWFPCQRWRLPHLAELFLKPYEHRLRWDRDHFRRGAVQGTAIHRSPIKPALC